MRKGDTVFFIVTEGTIRFTARHQLFRRLLRNSDPPLFLLPVPPGTSQHQPAPTSTEKIWNSIGGAR